MLRIGLISDTHGLLRPEALNALRGSNHVIHAGDIGNESILQALARIAPVSAVRGNNDTAEWARELPESIRLQFEGASLFVIHDIKELSISPQAEGIGVVVSGHSHRPKAEIRNGVLYINPGSSGPRRFKLPITLAELLIEGKTVQHRIIHLDEQ